MYHSADHSPAGGYRIYIPGSVYLSTDDWRDFDNRYRGGIFLWGYISRVRNSVCLGDTPPRIDMVLVLVVLLVLLVPPPHDNLPRILRILWLPRTRQQYGVDCDEMKPYYY